MGWTTGACATAAAKAAAVGVFTGEIPPSVAITLPRGDMAEFIIHDGALRAYAASATVIKDAGDDPDVTDKAAITTEVTQAPPGHGISFHAGEGVGIVTKPGLPIPPGEPAINPVPRQMIAGTLHDAAAIYGEASDFRVTISVAGGAELAKKTWNPRLGIEGGISILGTTGIVRPYSCSAWIASIHRGIDVARAARLPHVMGATGATSEAAVRAHYDLPEIACLDMGDFAGGLLKYLRTHPVPRLTLAGGIGKMTKLAQGALDLHSRRSQVDFDRLATWAGEIDADGAAVGAANTALEALEICGPRLAGAVAERALTTVQETLRDAPVETEVAVVSRTGEILAIAR